METFRDTEHSARCQEALEAIIAWGLPLKLDHDEDETVYRTLFKQLVTDASVIAGFIPRVRQPAKHSPWLHTRVAGCCDGCGFCADCTVHDRRPGAR